MGEDEILKDLRGCGRMMIGSDRMMVLMVL